MAIAMRSTGSFREIAIEAERYREELERAGFKYREVGGQTIFPVIDDSGMSARAVIYVAKLDADSNNAVDWVPIYFEPEATWNSLKSRIEAATKALTE